MTSLRARFRRGMPIELDGKPATIAQISPGGHWIHVSTGPGHAMALSESEARKRVRVPGENPELILTAAQALLLARVRETGGMFVRRAEVKGAKRLALLELVTLEDHGDKADDFDPSRSDGQRWMCTPRDAAAQHRSDLAATRDRAIDPTLTRTDWIMLAKCEVARRFPRTDKPSEKIDDALAKFAGREVLQPDRFPSLQRLEAAGLVARDPKTNIYRATDAGRDRLDLALLRMKG